jgi:hypothetical protein
VFSAVSEKPILNCIELFAFYLYTRTNCVSHILNCCAIHSDKKSGQNFMMHPMKTENSTLITINNAIAIPKLNLSEFCELFYLRIYWS